MGLFGTTHHFHKETNTVNVPYEKTVHEYKAPTDESVKLLNEFQEKARQNLLKSIIVNSNNVEAKALYYSDDLIDDRIHVYVGFKVNGREYEIRQHFDRVKSRNEMREIFGGWCLEVVYKWFHKKLSEIIAAEILTQCKDFKESAKNFNP